LVPPRPWGSPHGSSRGVMGGSRGQRHGAPIYATFCGAWSTAPIAHGIIDTAYYKRTAWNKTLLKDIESYNLKFQPLLKDVIINFLGINLFKYVVIEGRGYVKLNHDDVMNEESHIILDFTRNGIVKLCIRGDVIPRNEWVKDVAIIKIYR